LWNDYKKIFHQLIPNILKELDPERPYWPSSPSLGWGREDAYKKGDVHYWGVWWGKEPVEKYNEKTGRFMSEYGMQGMPDMKTIKQFSRPNDWDTSSAVMKVHQKHPFGWENIKYYIEQKFRTPKNFEDLVYVSQLMQADAIKTAIEAHRRNQPKTMGTMFWQWNDCWPVTSWSAVDYYGRKKALWYEVKRSFAEEVVLPTFVSGRLNLRFAADDDSMRNGNLKIECFSVDTVFESFLNTTKPFTLAFDSIYAVPSFTPQGIGAKITVEESSSKRIETILLFNSPKNLPLRKVKIKYEVQANQIELVADKFAYGVFIEVPDRVELEDNYFHILPGEKKTIKFTCSIPLEKLKRSIKVKSLVDTY
jgi:beta-mannosidase